MPKIYVWYPPDPSYHGKVFDVQHTGAIVINKPPKMSVARNVEKDTLDCAMIIETVTLTVKRWYKKGGVPLEIALDWDHSAAEGVMQPNAPSALQIIEMWPETIPYVCSEFNCPNCGITWGLPKYEYMTMFCLACNLEFSEQYILLLQNELNRKHWYEQQAPSEFEGVTDLDPTLWKSDGDLL